MEAFAGTAILLLVGVSIAVGIRLLHRWRHGGGAPELLLGLMLLLTVGVGYPTMIGADRTDGDLARALYLAANLSINIGFCFLFVFTWRVFRPGSGPARMLVLVGAAGLAANLAFRIVSLLSGAELAIASDAPLESLMQVLPVATAYSWTAIESLRYYAMMRRRVRLGLADAVVCNRFLLWGLMASCAIAGVALNLSAIALEVDVFSSPWVLLCSSLTGFAQTALMLLAFLPPRPYLRWLRSPELS